jgi:hypothetical protein
VENLQSEVERLKAIISQRAAYYKNMDWFDSGVIHQFFDSGVIHQIFEIKINKEIIMKKVFMMTIKNLETLEWGVQNDRDTN